MRQRSHALSLAAATAGLLLLAIAFTVPLSLQPGRFARLDGDGQFSIWNVAWVAHALGSDATTIWDANIFHPARATLAYSEANLVAGAMAYPLFALTGDPYVAHNVVLVLSFVLSGLGMYFLARRVSGDARAAWIAAVSFAFCPYVFAHLSHIQLLFTGGLPLVLLCFHRLADRPSVRGGLELGGAMALQTYACAYYGVFAVMLVGFGTLTVVALRARWADRGLWVGLATAAAAGALLIAPLAWPYLRLAEGAALTRPLAEARLYSALPASYLASAAYLHAWWRGAIGPWRDVLFPGLLVLALAPVAVVGGWRAGDRRREVVILYGCLAVLAAWASLGPDAGLYSLLYRLVPGFSFLRAPARLGILVQLALSLLAALAMADLFTRSKRTAAWVAALGAVAVAESAKPVKFAPVQPASRVYEVLAREPRGALLELPLYSNRFAFARTRYMVSSTRHWQPLVGGYSDVIPPWFLEQEPVLGEFPTDASLALLDRDDVRYVIVHRDDYSATQREALDRRLASFAHRMRVLATDGETVLYALVPAASGR